MPMNATTGRLFVVVVGIVLLVGCGQTSPTSPSSLFPSASAVSDGVKLGLWQALRGNAVRDARGDSASPSPYLDVVHAVVTEQGEGSLLFLMVVAGAIREPSEPFLLWVFHVDTNPATSPDGLYNEYIVRVRWSGGAFAGEVIDRTPLLRGGALITTPLPFSIDDSTVKLSVPLGALGNPSSFGWNAATRPLPPAAYLDFAPDDGIELLTWRQK